MWFKLHYLKNVHDYLKTQNREGADERFASIAKGPALQFIGNVIPPSHCLTRNYMLHHLWEDMIAKDTNAGRWRPPLRPCGHLESLKTGSTLPLGHQRTLQQG